MVMLISSLFHAVVKESGGVLPSDIIEPAESLWFNDAVLTASLVDTCTSSQCSRHDSVQRLGMSVQYILLIILYI